MMIGLLMVASFFSTGVPSVRDDWTPRHGLLFRAEYAAHLSGRCAVLLRDCRTSHV